MNALISLGAAPVRTMMVPPEIDSSQLAIFVPMRTTIVEEQEGRRVPLMISSEQEYYWWSKAWQEGEAEAEEDLREGRSRIFPDGRAAVRWFLSQGDDRTE